MGYLHDGENAEEMVQDVFVKIWENAPRLQIETSLLSYLYSSVRNACLNYLKHEKIKKKHEQETLQENNISESTESPVNFNFFKVLLAQTIGLLPEKCRQIFEMAKFEGLSYEEIAEYLQVSVKTVENQMGIALKKLRENMTPYMNQIYEQ